ncbi:MAG: DAK2 domain-containing protein [Dehalococcoidia bacterium]
MAKDTKATNRLTGAQFRHLVEAGARCLEANVEAINALNVFPVPDGDTGINMLLTLKAALAAKDGQEAAQASVAEVSRSLARAALLGARGNSGVIFSQYMKGMAVGLESASDCDGRVLHAALTEGANAAYKAVGNPVEGTMLSVMRAAAEGVTEPGSPPAQVLKQALAAAEQALARTPEQLPVLKEAGVVDAGGQGVVVFLVGALAQLEGSNPATTVLASSIDGTHPSVNHDFLEHSEEEMYGYCTQFIILGEGLNVDSLQQRVMEIATSTVVVGDGRVVRIHAHAEDPGPLLTLGARQGSLDQIKIENMDTQHQGFMALHGYSSERKAFAVVAVAPGKGLERLFIDLGAIPVAGGQTMNPSAQDLLDAVKRANADTTIVLPNNSNILMAAKQAAQLSGGKVIVVPSKTVPQGIAAMLRFSLDRSASENAASMQEALDEVHSGEITAAVRTTTVEGTPVTQGDAMALLEDHLVATAKTAHEALLQLVEHAGAEPGSLVTLYFGATVSAKDAMDSASAIEQRFKGIETQVLDGGQPHYHYIVSIE